VTDPFAPLRALANIPDLVERGKALGDALKNLPTVQAELRQARQEVVLALREQGWSHAQVAAEFGLTRSRAQQIAEGKTSTEAGSQKR
jgi:predicted XRE-type DNA-binding protein